LPFLAVGRVAGSVRLAYLINTDTESQKSTMDVFTKLLAAAASKLTPGQRTRLQWNDGSVCCLMDPKGELLFCVVTSMLTYPERLAYQLLYDLQAYIVEQGGVETAEEDGLMSAAEAKMKDLVRYYEDYSNFPQFALGQAQRSESFASTASMPMAAEGGGSRRCKLFAGLLLLLAIVGAILFFASRGLKSTGRLAIAVEDSSVAVDGHSLTKEVRGVVGTLITLVI